jgi:hypothetical protein
MKPWQTILVLSCNCSDTTSSLLMSPSIPFWDPRFFGPDQQKIDPFFAGQRMENISISTVALPTAVSRHRFFTNGCVSLKLGRLVA